MAVKTTTYTDDSGMAKTGYYDDTKGETYTDANLTQRVPTGSIVDTAAGQYVLTDTGSQKYDDYVTKQLEGVTKADTTTTNDYINQLYDQSLKAQLDEIAAQQSEIGTYYDTARNQAAATQTQNKAAFNEYAAASGLNAGTGGQAELARQNVYGNALNTANTAEAQALQDLAAQKSQAISSAASDRTQALYDESVRQQNLQAEQQATYAETQAAQQKAEYTQLEDYAKSLAAIGDYSGYQALYGWSDAQVAQAESLFKQQNTAKTTSTKSSGTSSGTGSTTTKSLTYAQAKALADNGNWSAAVLNTLRSYFTDAELAQMYPDFEAATGGTPVATTPTSTVSKTGIYSHLLGLPDDLILVTLGNEIDNGRLNTTSALNLANKLGVK